MKNFALLIFIWIAVSRVLSDVVQFSRTSSFPPVVFIPGDGGNMVEAHVDIKSKANAECPTHRDWYRVWLNLKELLPTTLPCQVEVFKLLFNSKTNISYYPSGVDIRIPGFGETHSVEYIDDSWEAFLLDNIGAYGHELVQALVSHGLVRNVSIRGAPYDFRLAMASQKDYFDRLRQLVENTYEINKNRKVALISHSLGGIYTTWFLNLQSQAWKDKFIDCFISLSTPWGGSSESIQAIVSGFTFHHSIILNPLITRIEQRTFESNFLLLPNAKIWPQNETFVWTDQKNYTTSRQDIFDLLKRIGVSTDLYDYVWDSNNHRSKVLPSFPGVKTYCIYGTKVATNHILDYRRTKFPNEQPKMMTIDGDGTVAHQSLTLCHKWNLGPDGIIEVPSASHNEVLQGTKGINAVLQILMSRV